MTLTGVGCRLQTCGRLASERFDSAFCAPSFDLFMPGADSAVCFVHWIAISPVDIVIQPSNNWATGVLFDSDD